MTFDFDLLDAAEQDVQGSFHDSKREVEALLDPVPSKTRSRARLWFEIKRFFEADGRGTPNGAVHCARELLLKTTLERFHQDGFVQIDAFLPQKIAYNLCDQLKLPVLDSVALQDSPDLHSGWVGSKYLRKYHKDVLAFSCSSANVQEQRSAFQVSGLKPEPSVSDLTGCEITFRTPAGELAAFQPTTKDEFLRSMKAFMHATADANSDACGDKLDKVHARFCFGDQSRRLAVDL